MRAAARRLVEAYEAEREAIDGGDPDKINALEAPAGPLVEVIPSEWTPEHIGKRIVEAFETLAKLPPERGPRTPGNNWPQHIYDWEDRLAQEEISEREKMRRRRVQNSVRLLASAEDLRRMDVVFEWISTLHLADADLCRIVQRWARLRAAGRSIKDWCRTVGLSFQIFYRRRDKGVAIIAEHLAGKPVW